MRARDWAWLLAISALAQTAAAAITFQDVTAGSGIAHQGESYGASWGSLDGDIYPDLFVSNHRTMVSLFRNNGDGTFTDRARSVTTWVKAPSRDTHAGAWADFDNDGDQDLMVGTGRGNDNQFFVNNGGLLEDRTAQYGLRYPDWAGRQAIWFDYNNDGLLDFVMGQYNGKSAFLQQTSSGFKDPTAASGINCTTTPYEQLLDVNHDGRPDLVCGADGTFPGRAYDFRQLPFRDITSALPAVGHSVDTVIADFDGDQIPDIFFARGTLRTSAVAMNGDNKIEADLVNGTKTMIFRTSGRVYVDLDWRTVRDNGNLNNIRIGAAGIAPKTLPFTLDPADPTVDGLKANTSTADYLYIGYNRATSEWTFRLNSNGKFSNVYLMLSANSQVTGLRTAGFFSAEGPMPSVLYGGQTSGFVNRTAAAGLSAPISCVSGVAADFDNDMDDDLYLVCRTGVSNIVNRLYMNRGNGVFDLVAGAGGAAGPVGLSIADGAGTGDTVVVADYDVDGYVDLFVTNGLNMEPLGIGGPSRLYRNLGKGNNWIELDLQGQQSNRDGVGARVYATVPGKTQLRLQDGGYHRAAQNSQRIHFGLARNALVDLRVEWPSGRVDNYGNVAVNRLYRATEGGGLAALTPARASANDQFSNPR
jgi:hypothetical protein